MRSKRVGESYTRSYGKLGDSPEYYVTTEDNETRDPSATSVARFFGSRPDGRAGGFQARLGTPLPVPSTSIYSRSDGIVAWRSCLEVGAPLCENIEVRSSHCGMGHHPAVLLVIAERLAQPEGAWRPFDPRGRALWPFVVEPVKTLAQGGES